MQFQNNISDWSWRIKKTGHTQKSFAAICGVHQTLISSYVTGRSVPTLINYYKVEDKLKELEA